MNLTQRPAALGVAKWRFNEPYLPLTPQAVLPPFCSNRLLHYCDVCSEGYKLESMFSRRAGSFLTSLHKLVRSAPEQSCVACATERKSTSSASGMSLVRTFKMSCLDVSSGGGTYTSLSNLPGRKRASSNRSGRGHSTAALTSCFTRYKPPISDRAAGSVVTTPNPLLREHGRILAIAARKMSCESLSSPCLLSLSRATCWHSNARSAPTNPEAKYSTHSPEPVRWHVQTPSLVGVLCPLERVGKPLDPAGLRVSPDSLMLLDAQCQTIYKHQDSLEIKDMGTSGQANLKLHSSCLKVGGSTSLSLLLLALGSPISRDFVVYNGGYPTLVHFLEGQDYWVAFLLRVAYSSYSLHPVDERARRDRWTL
uniref:Uncharacterized protein n=1 Tax=Timema poppense TaxID=170557 RepID=A0A7R9D664_TIMPO|nr:unnamed protein product [Timema poppensis]